MLVQTKEQVVDDFLSGLKQTEREMLENLNEANQRYSNTSKVIVAVIGILAIGLSVSLFLIMQFARDIDQMIVSMDSLDQQIVVTHVNTRQMSASLSGVAEKTALIPQLVQSTSSIGDNIATMNGFFTGIEYNSISMSQSADVIDSELKQVGHRFQNVNQNMERIVYNLQQLSKNVP